MPKVEDRPRDRPRHVRDTEKLWKIYGVANFYTYVLNNYWRVDTTLNNRPQDAKEWLLAEILSPLFIKHEKSIQKSHRGEAKFRNTNTFWLVSRDQKRELNITWNIWKHDQICDWHFASYSNF